MSTSLPQGLAKIHLHNKKLTTVVMVNGKW